MLDFSLLVLRNISWKMLFAKSEERLKRLNRSAQRKEILVISRNEHRTEMGAEDWQFVG
jgi:hypothetical protein